jgi:hypothetical protein
MENWLAACQYQLIQFFSIGIGASACKCIASECVHKAPSLNRAVPHGRQLQQSVYLCLQHIALPVTYFMSVFAGVFGQRKCSSWQLQFLHWHSSWHNQVCNYKWWKGAHWNRVTLCREEIAGCLEKAYEKIAVSEAARMLFFDSEKPMREYSATVRSWFSFITKSIMYHVFFGVFSVIGQEVLMGISTLFTKRRRRMKKFLPPHWLFKPLAMPGSLIWLCECVLIVSLLYPINYQHVYYHAFSVFEIVHPRLMSYHQFHIPFPPASAFICRLIHVNV